jgi:DNA-binding NarL/FixJ family response regulator
VRVVLFSSDLMVTSRVDGSAARAGAVAKTVASIDALVDACQSNQTDLVIVDLSAPALDVAQLVECVKAIGEVHPKIVAFGPHVHEALLSAARDAACDEVISRGQFFAKLDSIIGQDTNQSTLGGD